MPMLTRAGEIVNVVTAEGVTVKRVVPFTAPTAHLIVEVPPFPVPEVTKPVAPTVATVKLELVHWQPFPAVAASKACPMMIQSRALPVHEMEPVILDCVLEKVWSSDPASPLETRMA